MQGLIVAGLGLIILTLAFILLVVNNQLKLQAQDHRYARVEELSYILPILFIVAGLVFMAIGLMSAVLEALAAYREDRTSWMPLFALGRLACTFLSGLGQV
ncbi:MAG TPA: hypothetical protein EYP85_13215 [Armatimonadetes bacterium]|nr:hypothetical protein [Armatimonadota bacterium]